MSNTEKINYPASKQEYKVLVRCFTFNHSRFIGDALNGFAMQQTNFPFVCLVMDDASTDGEQEVIKEWMERECDMNRAETIDIPTSVVIIVPHKTNASCTFAFYLLKQNLYGTGDKKMNHVYPWRDKCEYEALCEGDDYWIDPLKLQKQVDFLENHPDYSLCFHNAVIFYEDTPISPKFFCNIVESCDISLEEITDSWIVPTASMLYRKDVVENYPTWTKQIYSGDLTLQMIAFSKGKLYYMNQIMSFYRITYNGNSASSAMKGRLEFVCAQHALLYKLYDEFTGYKFHDILKKRIAFKEKHSRFYKYRKKGRFYTFLRMPFFYLKMFLKSNK